MGWRPSSSVLRRPLTSSPQKLPRQSLPNLVCSICRGRLFCIDCEILKLRHGYIDHIVEFLDEYQEYE